MTTLADKAILLGADNRPPMLEKDTNQADCDIKATNIILPRITTRGQTLVSNHKVAKELWERIPTSHARKRDDSWFKDKVLLVQAQANGQILHEEELAFLVNPGIAEDSSAQSVEIDRLKQTLAEHLKEKEYLIQTFTLLKNDFKKEESRNIDREIALEKRIKQLDNIVFKRDQSAQTIHLSAHSDNLKNTQEEAAILREIVEQKKSQNPLNESLACALKPSTSASGSQPSGNTKKDKIQRTPSSTQKNKVKAHPRTIKSSLKNKNSVVEPKGIENVQHSKLNANSEPLCVKCNGCMLSD
ncbi:hypothetical protein Tco_0853580 [Tanacetum coccineum]